MKKSYRNMIMLICCLMICLSVIILPVIACEVVPSSDCTEEGYHCHLYDTDDGPEDHHIGPRTMMDIFLEMSDDERNHYCDLDYTYKRYHCNYCLEVIGSNESVVRAKMTPHNWDIGTTDPGDENAEYWYCRDCGYIFDPEIG